MKAGGRGGAKDDIEPSDEPSDLAQSLFFVKFCAADLFEEYNWEKRLKNNVTFCLKWTFLCFISFLFKGTVKLILKVLTSNKN